MNTTTERTTFKSTDSTKYPSVSSYLVEWQMIVLFSILGIGLVANILNHIVLKRGFSDTIMLHYMKYMNAVDAAYCAFNILGKTFECWNYTHYKWLAEIYYYFILYGRFSLENLAIFMFVLIAIDRIRASNRYRQQFAQKYMENTKRRIVSNLLITAAVIMGFVCSLPLFYVFKIRQAYYEGDYVYTIMYVKPDSKQEPFESCVTCTRYRYQILLSQINVERLYFAAQNILPRGILFLCLIVFIYKLTKIIDRYRYIKHQCEQENEERHEERPYSCYWKDCVSDLSLVPAIVITIVLFSIVIITCGVITYLRNEKIIILPRGKTMRKVVNILLRMPINLCCAMKFFIYLMFNARYRDYVVNIIKLRLCCRKDSRYEVNSNQDNHVRRRVSELSDPQDSLSRVSDSAVASKIRWSNDNIV